MGEANEYWPTKVLDIAIGVSILKHYADSNHGKLSLSKNELPQWMMALANAFKSQHGADYYPFVLDNFMRELTYHLIAQGISPERAEEIRKLSLLCIQENSPLNS